MDIQNLGTPSAAQRRHYHETPDSSFYDSFQAAFAAHTAQGTPHAGTDSSANTSTAAAAKTGDLADILGTTHTQLSALRGVSEASQATYAAVLNRAYGSDGQHHARQFLAGLSTEELQAVQKNHCLADPINVSQLSEEGAENLLLPEGYTVDLNNDGIDEVGIGKSISIPPKAAPTAFKEAWYQATASMDEGAVMTYGLMLHGSIYGIQADGHEGNGTPVYAPDSLASYQQVVDNYLAMLESERGKLAPGQYERDKDFFSRLQTLLHT